MNLVDKVSGIFITNFEKTYKIAAYTLLGAGIIEYTLNSTLTNPEGLSKVVVRGLNYTFGEITQIK